MIYSGLDEVERLRATESKVVNQVNLHPGSAGPRTQGNAHGVTIDGGLLGNRHPSVAKIGEKTFLGLFSLGTVGRTNLWRNGCRRYGDRLLIKLIHDAVSVWTEMVNSDGYDFVSISIFGGLCQGCPQLFFSSVAILPRDPQHCRPVFYWMPQ